MKLLDHRTRRTRKAENDGNEPSTRAFWLLMQPPYSWYDCFSILCRLASPTLCWSPSGLRSQGLTFLETGICPEVMSLVRQNQNHSELYVSLSMNDRYHEYENENGNENEEKQY
jgi:hypothetical protein